MSPSIIHPANENSNTESSQNEARELLFADLPPALQKNLKKSEAAGVHVRAWVVKGLRGQCAAALVLSQYLFWAVRSPEGPGGPFWISIAQIKKQTGLGRAAYEKAHGKLKKLGFCDESFDLYNKRTVRLKWQRILALFEATQQSPPFAGITPKGFAGITPKAPLPVIPPKLEIPLRDSEENLSRATAFDERNVASLPEGKEAEATPAPSGDTTTSEGQNERKVGNKKKVVSLQPKLNAKREVDTLVCNFYSTIGQPHIPKGLLKRGHKQLVQLLEDYTLEDVAVAIDYVRDGQRDDKGRLLDERKKPIGSIGYLSHIIARAVEEKKAKAEAEARQRARERHARIEDDERARKAREELLANMPSWLSPSMRDKVLKGY